MIPSLQPLPQPIPDRYPSEDGRRLETIVRLLAHCLEQGKFQAAATAFVNQLATQLNCSRVSLGLYKRNRHRVVAISHAAQAGRNSNLLTDLASAMDEARDQGCSVIHPAPRTGNAPVALAHGTLAKNHHLGPLCTVLLTNAGKAIGSVTLERPPGEPFDAAEVRLCEQIGVLVGPVLDLKRREERWLLGRIWDSLGGGFSKLFGPRYALLKLIVILGLGLAAFLYFATGTYRVSADAVLEPSIQRAVVAPQDGFIASAPVRAGALVGEHDLLGTLDSRDLELEQAKWGSKRDKLLKEYRSALAAHDRAKASVLSAQIAQAAAELDLLGEQLLRIKLAAPFKGIVVSGDLSRSLGSPVNRGDVLFEVAPLDAYRVVLQVEERDISRIRVGQAGHVTLSALPDRPFGLIIDKITPVAEVVESRNRFRVEASLEDKTAQLRPGMAGLAKIEIEERLLVWIWTHRFLDWAKLQLWSWWF